MEEKKSYGYLLGQLTAICEGYEGGESKPPHLLALVLNNPSKLDYWLTELLRGECEDIASLPGCAKSDLMELAADFYEQRDKQRNPLFLPLSEQGQAHLGYYQQKARASVETVRERMGKRVKELREAKGMSQRELAEYTGIDFARISRIEKGKCNITVDTLSKLGAVLDMPLGLE